MNSTSVLQQLVAIERRSPSEWMLWDAIRDDVATYFDQSPSPWSIDNEALGSQSLAINFFFPLRADLRGLARLLGVLCGRQLSVDAFELICRGRAATLALPFDVVAHLHEDDDSSMLLALKCMAPRAQAASQGSVHESPRAGVLRPWSAAESVCDVRVPYLAHGQRLADDLERNSAVDRAVFAVVYDNRDVSFADLCAFWHRTRAGDGRFHAWTYQQMLALAGSTMGSAPGWRTFLARRYGITAIGSRAAHARAPEVRCDGRRSA
jgi:hypothetical protein